MSMQSTLHQFVGGNGKRLVRPKSDPEDATLNGTPDATSSTERGKRLRLQELVAAPPSKPTMTRVECMYEVTGLSANTLKHHMAALTMVPKEVFVKASDSSFPAYTFNDDTLCVPRWYGTRHFGAAREDATTMGVELSDAAADFRGALQAHQLAPTQKVLDVCLDEALPSPRGGMVSLGCGQGKTVVALYIAARLKRRTLVLCHKAFLIEQWEQRIAAFLPGASIGVVKQARVEVDADVVVASLQSIAMRNYDASIFHDFGLLIVDEAHHLSAPCLSKALQKLPTRFVLALSATPVRRDGLTPLLYESMGPLLYKMERPSNERVLITRLVYANRNTQVELLGGKDQKPLYARMLNALADDSERTARVAQFLEPHLKAHRQVIVLSDRINQLEALHRAVVALCEHMSDQTALYIGRCSSAERADAATKQLILSTYSLAREGLDLARLDTLCLLSPSSSVEQAVGRILRPDVDGTKHTPLVLDVVDNFSLFAHMAQKRQRYYKSRGYEIQDVPLRDWTPDDARLFR